MENSIIMSELQPKLSALRSYFDSGETKPYTYRITQLKKLKQAICKYEKEIYQALYTDLKKSAEETWFTESGMALATLSITIKKLRSWMKEKKVRTNLVNLPSRSRIINEPLGVVCIIGPWNYPFQLLILPLIGAIAAGNCVVLKPSEHAPATAAVIKKIITELFPENYILLVEGTGETVIPRLLNHFTFNHIFFTGSTAIGQLIYQMAAERLVPVTLELGGKSPCVIESDANIRVAARRIVSTKFSNAGQMCVAPDYLLVHHSIKDQLLDELKTAIQLFYTDKPEESYDLGKMINEKQFHRVAGYLSQGYIEYGGKTDKEKLFIAPTIMTGVSPNAPVMREEIFGPLLPVFSFTTMEEARAMISQHPDPLAFYIYTSSKNREKQWLNAVPAGGCCVNNSSFHLTNHHLPFGGRGKSGIGNYHGKFSFDTFSHSKAVMKTPTWFDPSFKYPTYKGRLSFFKKMLR